jgi:serine/threonine-protein phosphatase PP1 catalytic subunit
MGNQNSKGESGTSTPKGGASQSSLAKPDMDNLQSYPSFSKADTKESNRSFRGAIRSKIPGSKTDSPRGSSSGLLNGDGTDKSDGASVRYDTPICPSVAT